MLKNNPWEKQMQSNYAPSEEVSVESFKFFFLII